MGVGVGGIEVGVGGISVGVGGVEVEVGGIVDLGTALAVGGAAPNDVVPVNGVEAALELAEELVVVVEVVPIATVATTFPGGGEALAQATKSTAAIGAATTIGQPVIVVLRKPL